MTRTAALVVVMLIAARADAAPCSATVLLTAPDATIFDGGGVVAEVGSDLPSWHLQDGGGVGFAPLAPGLVLFGPIRQSGWTLVRDAANAPVIRVQYALADKRALGVAAPAIAAVVGDGAGAEGAVVRLAAPPPPGALALVLFGLTAHGQVAEAWGRAAPNSIALSPAASCHGVDARAGDRVAAAWVDAAGRTSVLSPPVTVTTGR